jgi:L-ascorbate metabolism protein UlaG (beta-lactamase superfamily)
LKVNPQARLLIARANVEFVLQRLGPVGPRLTPVDGGETARAGDLQIAGIPAAHNTVERDERGRFRFLGYVATIGTLKVYHSGDTMFHDGLIPALKPLAVDIALLPINGNKPERKVAGNLNGIEAARLAKAIGVRLVIPHHFDMFAFNTEPPDEFESECRRLGQAFRTLKNGEGVSLSFN